MVHKVESKFSQPWVEKNLVYKLIFNWASEMKLQIGACDWYTLWWNCSE
jgi:hypothetical protein